MSECSGVVVAVAAPWATVELPERAPACGNCSKADGCHTGLLGLTSLRRYRVRNTIGAKVGDGVTVLVAEGTVWHASLLSYVVPAILAILGAAIGQTGMLFGKGSDIAALAGTLLGLVVGFLWLRRGESRARERGDLILLQRQHHHVHLMKER